MFVRYYRFVEMSEEDLDKETIGRKVSERSKSFPTRKLFFQLAESLPFELLEEYRQIFSFFDRWSKFELQMMRLAMISVGTNGLIMTNYSMRDPH